MSDLSTAVISEGGFNSLPSSLDGEGVTQADADLFQRNIYGDGTTNKSFANDIIDKFSEVSKDIGIKKDDYEVKLEKAAKSGDQLDILEATRAMGDYQLQVLLSTKVASKATSAIDKLTNLQ